MTSILSNITNFDVCSTLQSFTKSDICAERWSVVADVGTKIISQIEEFHTNFTPCQNFQDRFNLDLCGKGTELAQQTANAFPFLKEISLPLKKEQLALTLGIAAATVFMIRAVAINYFTDPQKTSEPLECLEKLPEGYMLLSNGETQPISTPPPAKKESNEEFAISPSTLFETNPDKDADILKKIEDLETSVKSLRELVSRQNNSIQRLQESNEFLKKRVLDQDEFIASFIGSSNLTLFEINALKNSIQESLENPTQTQPPLRNRAETV